MPGFIERGDREEAENLERYLRQYPNGCTSGVRREEKEVAEAQRELDHLNKSAQSKP